MDTKEAGRRGALITNTKLTPESRRKAAKLGWRLRKKRLAEIIETRDLLNEKAPAQ